MMRAIIKINDFSVDVVGEILKQQASSAVNKQSFTTAVINVPEMKVLRKQIIEMNDGSFNEDYLVNDSAFQNAINDGIVFVMGVRIVVT